MVQSSRFISLRLLENFPKCRKGWLMVILSASALFGYLIMAIAHQYPSRQFAQTANSPRQSPATQQIRSALAINLTRFGFEPAAATVSAGKCFITIRNMTGTDSINLTISSKQGQTLLAEKTQKERRRWDKLLDLTPGDYVISAEGNPDWVYALTILPPNQQ